MNINENNKFELIDDYLSGGMTQDELDGFRAFMQSDKDLAVDTAITAELSEATAFATAEAQLRSTLDQIRTDRVGSPMDNNRNSGTTNSYWKLGVVAALLGVLTYILLTTFNPFSETKNSPAQYAMVEPLELATKSSEDAANLVQLESTYNKGDYASALPIINNYLSEHPEDIDVLLAKGIALSETAAFDKAHAVFATIAALQPRVKKHLWFDAIAYMKSGETEKAKKMLSDILKTKSYNYEHVESLLARL